MGVGQAASHFSLHPGLKPLHHTALDVCRGAILSARALWPFQNSGRVLETETLRTGRFSSRSQTDPPKTSLYPSVIEELRFFRCRLNFLFKLTALYLKNKVKFFILRAFLAYETKF